MKLITTPKEDFCGAYLAAFSINPPIFFNLWRLFDINAAKLFLGFKELSRENRFTLAAFFIIITGKLHAFFEINTVNLILEFGGNNLRRLYFS